MSWSKKLVLEFIELLEDEPCIWNFKIKFRNSQKRVIAAWNRIKKKMSVPYSIKDLKIKRNSLFTQYRLYLRKIKASSKTESDAEEIYEPMWFAFDSLHKYMGPIYGFTYRPKLPAGNQEKLDEFQISLEENLEESYLDPLSGESVIKRSMSLESISRSESDYFSDSKRQLVQDSLMGEHQIDEAFSIIKDNYNHRENEKSSNECDLYGQLLAEKLMNLEDDDRLVLMNEIDNCVFKYILNARKRRKEV